jgi:hypothetical protein
MASTKHTSLIWLTEMGKSSRSFYFLPVNALKKEVVS